MIAILGSGFGLYGYLPALAGGCDQRVILPEHYRARFEERPELSPYSSVVRWVANEASALDCADGAVIALRPADQADWIPRCLKQTNLQRLLLEKPLASSPEVAARLWHDLSRSDKVIRLGYNFRHTAWGKRLLEEVSGVRASTSLQIEWTFLAHHFRFQLNNWKRSTASGGGAIRFYGIQLIALLAELGYREVLSSRSYGRSVDEVEKWTASFAGPNLPCGEVLVDTRAATERFRVELSGLAIVDQGDPFVEKNGGPHSVERDRRIPALARLCRSLWEPKVRDTGFYEATIELWRRIEEKTLFEERT